MFHQNGLQCSQDTAKASFAYAVAHGRKPGLYFSWFEAKAQVLGFPKAKFERFQVIKEAEDYLKNAGLVSTQPGRCHSTTRDPIWYIPRSSITGKRKEGAVTKSQLEIQIFSEIGENQAGNFRNTSKRHRTSSNLVEAINQGENFYGEVGIEETDWKNLNLDSIQQEAIDAAINGENLFLTGVAGTGKSLVTELIVKKAKGTKREVAVAAPTGVAAVNLNLGAQTVHSLAGIRVPQRARDFTSMKSKWNAKKWRKIEVLVIDEIGMIAADFLDWLDTNVRRIRNNCLEPFGGIQLVFVGDFAQLGPVPGTTSLYHSPYSPNEKGADCVLNIKECTAFAFQSAAWREAKFRHIHLKKVYRQNDQGFVQALIHLRESKPHSKLVENLVKHCRPPLELRKNLEIPDGIKPTVLYCTNYKVDKENHENLVALTTEGKRFEAVDTVEVDPDLSPSESDVVGKKLQRDSFFEQCQAARDLDLKIGAQVMLLRNLSDTLVNGSRGVIQCFKLCPVVRNGDGKERIIGPDESELHPGRHFDELKWGVILEFERQSWTIFKFLKFPYVKFMNKESKIIVPAIFERNLYRQGKCKRIQVPLRLAWALTIHKAQGSSLDLVICDLQGCFTAGQAYVALSRARSMSGLQIKNFHPGCVKTDSLVESFYEALDLHDVENFLRDRAGLWWFPLLKSPKWLDMFENAKYKDAEQNSKQFKEWLLEYKPGKSYNGWYGRIKI